MTQPVAMTEKINKYISLKLSWAHLVLDVPCKMVVQNAKEGWCGGGGGGGAAVLSNVQGRMGVGSKNLKLSGHAQFWACCVKQ